MDGRRDGEGDGGGDRGTGGKTRQDNQYRREGGRAAGTTDPTYNFADMTIGDFFSY